MPKVAVNGVQLYYEEAGRGTPILFVHGFASDYRRNEHQMRFFSRNYRTITYSARGYEPSDVPTDPRKYSWDLVVDDIGGLLDAIGVERAHICGFSMGGEVALSFTLRRPDRVLSLTYAAGGYGSGSRRERWLPTVDELADTYRREGMAGPRARAYTESWEQAKRKDPRGWAEWRERFMEYNAVGMANTLAYVSKHRPDVTTLGPQLRALETPVLIVIGDEDEPGHEASLFVKRAVPLAGMEMFARTGHPVSMEEPGRFNRTVQEFLTAVESGTWTAVRTLPPL